MPSRQVNYISLKSQDVPPPPSRTVKYLFIKSIGPTACCSSCTTSGCWWKKWSAILYPKCRPLVAEENEHWNQAGRSTWTRRRDWRWSSCCSQSCSQSKKRCSWRIRYFIVFLLDRFWRRFRRLGLNNFVCNVSHWIIIDWMRVETWSPEISCPMWRRGSLGTILKNVFHLFLPFMDIFDNCCSLGISC